MEAWQNYPNIVPWLDIILSLTSTHGKNFRSTKNLGCYRRLWNLIIQILFELHISLHKLTANGQPFRIFPRSNSNIMNEFIPRKLTQYTVYHRHRRTQPPSATGPSLVSVHKVFIVQSETFSNCTEQLLWVIWYLVNLNTYSASTLTWDSLNFL